MSDDDKYNVSHLHTHKNILNDIRFPPQLQVRHSFITIHGEILRIYNNTSSIGGVGCEAKANEILLDIAIDISAGL